MQGVAIELRVTCGGCGQHIPINAFTPRITCPACNRAAELSDEQWESLLEDAIDESPEMPEGEGSTSTIMTGAGTFSLMYGNQPPRCRACKTNVPDGAAELAGRGRIACVGCGQMMTIRPAPPQLQDSGIKLLIGEDAAQLPGGGPGDAAAASAPRASNPVVLYCPHCKAPLSVDGSNRMVKCQYCSTDVYLPDDLWARLRPVAQVARWYLVFGAEVDVAQRSLTRFKWSSFRDAVMDAHKNIFCVGEDDDHDFCVWCLGPDLQPRWIRKGLDFSDDARIALDPRGRLVLWQRGKHSLVRLSAADGSDLDRLGGRQPDDATTHTLDLEHCKLFLADVDGTYLALLGERFVRFAEDGTPLPTWPPRAGIFGKRAEKLRPVYGPGHDLISIESAAYVESIGHHPTEVDDYTKMHIGADGRLFMERSEMVACFDREGKRLWRTGKLPISSVRGDRMGTDGGGNLYLYAHLQGNPTPRVIVRVSPGGERVDIVAGDRRTGGAVADESNLVVAPDGMLFLMGYGRETRVLGPDGRLLYISDESKEEDADEDKEAARRA
jgi:uncharacterized CHY-type Zn-finger protein